MPQAKRALILGTDRLPILHRVLALEILKIRKAPKFANDDSVRTAITSFVIADTPEVKKSWRAIRKEAKARGIEIPVEGVPADVIAWRTATETEPDPEDPEEDGADEDRFDMSFSSETAVPRWFGDEILDHSSAAIDMSRAKNGLAYLVDHETRDQVGLIENFRLENGKTRGTVRFSRSARGQEIKRDVEDGIRPFTSIGYRVSELVLEKEEKDGQDTHRTYRVTRWAPMEGSTVAVPADPSVGANRSEEDFAVAVRSGITSRSATIIESEEFMNPKQTAEVLRLCKAHGVSQERAMEIIETEGMTSERAASMILEDVAKRDAEKIPTRAAEVTLTDAEQRRYNLCRGIMLHVSNVEKNKRDTSFETEVSDEIAKKYEGKKRGGLFVPWRLGIDPQLVRNAADRFGAEMLKRAGIATALTAGTSTKGEELVFTEPGPFIQFLYNAMRLKELGAVTMSGLQGNIAFPKQTGRATGSWVEENPGADVADSNATLSQVTMTPKTYQTSASYSRQLLAQAVIDIDNLVRADLARDAALAIDLAGISGDGGSNNPKGILHTTGVQAYDLLDDSGDGAKPKWDDITMMEELLEEANADQIGSFSWLTTPGIKGLFKRSPRLLYAPAGGTVVNVTGSPIWSDDNEIDGLPAAWSNQVPNDGSEGGSSGICHSLILGVFSSMINGLWGSGFELVVDPYRLKKQGLIELTTFILTDWAVRYPAGFVTAVNCLKS